MKSYLPVLSTLLCAMLCSPVCAGSDTGYCLLKTKGAHGIGLAGHGAGVEFINVATDLSERAVGPRNPVVEIRGSRDLVITPGADPLAINGTKFFPGEVGSGVVTQIFTIRNTGTTDLILANPAVSFTGSPYISVSSQPGTSTVPAGSSISFTMSFDRSVFGLHVGTVNIHSNAVVSPSFNVEGRAYNAGPPTTFTFVGITPIPDNTPAGVDLPYAVSGLSGQICHLQVRINGTDCSTPTGTGIQHTFVGDLLIRLTSPKGKIITLVDRIGVPATDNGVGTNNFCNTVLDDNGNSPIENAQSSEAPFSQTYKPEHPIYEVAGDQPNGLWTLNVADLADLDAGTVRSVSLIFRTETSPAAAKDWELFY